MLIAIDWGSTSRRSYLVAEDGTVINQQNDQKGVLSMVAEDYPSAIIEVRRAFGDLPVVISGMAGSRHGWIETQYLPAPATISDLARCAVAVGDMACWVLPGVSYNGPGSPDVMRGEEVIVLGALAAGLVPADAQVCQPGTHNKWITTEDGRIVSLRTAMTGELFALLRTSGTLAPFLGGTVRIDDGFRLGVTRSLRERDLLGALFGARASVLLGQLDPAIAASYVSGVLIGADVAHAGDCGTGAVHVIGEGELATLYAAALAEAGMLAVPIDSNAAFVAGATAVWRLL